MSHGHDDIDDMDDEEIRERLREELGTRPDEDLDDEELREMLREEIGAGMDDRTDDAVPRSGGCTVILLAAPLIGWMLGG